MHNRILCVLLISLFLCLYMPMQTAKATSWLEGWNYRKSHNIINATGANTGYQLNITAFYGTGIDAHNFVYLNSHSKTDFSDLRFTDDDGITLLSAYNETQYNGINITIWIKINDNLSNDNATIYLYYGKSDASAYWNGANTFIDFDDFEDGLIHATWEKKWIDGTDLITITEANGKLTFTHAGTTTTSFLLFVKNTTRNTPIAITATIDTKNWATDTKVFGLGIYKSTSDFSIIGAYDYSGYQADIMTEANHYHTTDTISANTVYTWMGVINSTYGTRQFRDNVNKVSGTGTDTKDASGKVGLGFWYGYLSSTQTIDVLLWYARLCTDPEPYNDAWGTQEGVGVIWHSVEQFFTTFNIKEWLKPSTFFVNMTFKQWSKPSVFFTNLTIKAWFNASTFFMTITTKAWYYIITLAVKHAIIAVTDNILLIILAFFVVFIVLVIFAKGRKRKH